MRTILEHVNGNRVRVVRVPFNNRWLARFNRRFDVDKSHYDGTFSSRLGFGYCTAIQPFRFMEYTFLEIHS